MSNGTKFLDRYFLALFLSLIPSLSTDSVFASPPQTYWAPKSLVEIALNLRFYGPGPNEVEEFIDFLAGLNQLEDPIQYESFIARRIGLTADIRKAIWHLDLLYLSGNPRLSSRAISRLIRLFESGDFGPEATQPALETYYKKLADYLIERMKYETDGSSFCADSSGVAEVRRALYDSFVKSVSDGNHFVINRYLENFKGRDIPEDWKPQIYSRFDKIYPLLQADHAKLNLLKLMLEESKALRKQYPVQFITLTLVIARELDSMTTPLSLSLLNALKEWPGKRDFVPLLKALTFRGQNGFDQRLVEALFVCRGGYCPHASDPSSFGYWESPQNPWNWPGRAKARLLEWRDLVCVRAIKTLREITSIGPTK